MSRHEEKLYKTRQILDLITPKNEKKIESVVDIEEVEKEGNLVNLNNFEDGIIKENISQVYNITDPSPFKFEMRKRFKSSDSDEHPLYNYENRPQSLRVSWKF
jgi:hypothetical protein